MTHGNFEGDQRRYTVAEGRQDRWLVTQHYGQDGGALWTLYD
jgi:hypothetical protein